MILHFQGTQIHIHVQYMYCTLLYNINMQYVVHTYTCIHYFAVSIFTYTCTSDSYALCPIRFNELSNKSQQVDAITNVEFIVLDCSPLKFSIMSHIDDIITRLQDLLLQMSTKRLANLLSYMDTNAKTYCLLLQCCHLLIFLTIYTQVEYPTRVS